MMRTRLLTGSVVLLGLSATSCLNPPSYPETPSIEFKSIRAEKFSQSAGSTPVYRPIITVTFKDGDGDLGISEDLPSYDPPNDFNYFIDTYLRNPQTGEFELLGGPGAFNSRFPPLAPNPDKKAPLKGDLNFEVRTSLLDVPSYTGAQMQFKLRIRDRALNESNTITTSVLTLQ
ncbi:hypothetical protein F0P96_01760 [Hymenobacter busanensis]|uniref:Uncharacterized protein n=1 Tax=Hymenobacter busanensis TaxID=2607656 RepID=A0A7L4ZUL3_9BACT|nr:hypothetical protein [Hymenobacter busanensis]KAA9339371.1 hypothetical protein F0P96_01760 [Hymenobacter busanensis]QHJ06868.1 hypothetical protein GUY19_05990 [Hymenobacter busanensis]